MSNVTAYICDYRGHLVHEDKAVGITMTEDLFDKLLSYPTIMNPKKAFCHYCTDCYKKDVLRRAAKEETRKDSEDAYKLKIKELSFSLRNSAVKNFRSGKKTL